MKKLTKIMSVLLACAMLFAMAIPATVASAEDTLAIAVESVEAAPGAKAVEVKVFVPSEPNWSAVDITVNFDATKLTFKKFVLNQEVKDQGDNGDPQVYALNKDNAESGEVIIAFATATTAGGYEGYYGGEYDYLGTLTFDVVEGVKGMCDITATIGKLVNKDQADVAFAVTNGGINVKVDPCAECVDWDEGVVTTPATCEEDGVKTYTCQKCGNTKTEVIVASGTHAWDEGKVTTEPTVDAEGVKTYTCDTCGATKTEAIEKLPFEGLDIVIEKVNAKAGDEAVDVKIFVPSNPNWSAVDITVNFDATKLTFKKFVLNQEVKDQGDNGDPQVYALNKDNAANGEVIIAFATATTAGGYEGYYGGEYDYLGTLTFDIPEGVADGLIDVTATIGKLVNKDQANVVYRVTNGGIEITSCEHNWVESSRTPATCEVDGEIVYTCSGTCGGTKTEAIPAIGHAWDNGVVTTAPTCSAEGVKTFTCANDATHTKTEAVAIDADAHKLGEKTVVDATCTEAGSETGTCELCGKDVVVEIPALGHDWDEGKVTTEPTTDAEGVKTYTCGTCGETKTEAVEKLPAQGGDNTNTGDVAVATSAIVALVASAAVLVITRKKRLAK